MNRKELANLIELAIQKRTDRLVDLKESPVRQYTLGQKNALEDVLSALRNNPVYLNILAKGG